MIRTLIHRGATPLNDVERGVFHAARFGCVQRPLAIPPAFSEFLSNRYIVDYGRYVQIRMDQFVLIDLLGRGTGGPLTLPAVLIPIIKSYWARTNKPWNHQKPSWISR